MRSYSQQYVARLFASGFRRLNLDARISAALQTNSIVRLVSYGEKYLTVFTAGVTLKSGAYLIGTLVDGSLPQPWTYIQKSEK
jgi:hypothetical protein